MTRFADQDTPNPDFLHWIRQDKLLFGALTGSIFAPLIPLIQQPSTSCDGLTLANTFSNPPHGHIKKIKDQLKHAIKGSQIITDYMQFIKCHVDQLAALGKPLDHEDLINKILDGLNDDYKIITDIVQNRETPILFDELHEKSINRELALKHLQSSHSQFLVTANMASGCPTRRTLTLPAVILLPAPRPHFDTQRRPPSIANLAHNFVGAKVVTPLVSQSVKA